MEAASDTPVRGGIAVGRRPWACRMMQGGVPTQISPIRPLPAGPAPARIGVFRSSLHDVAFLQRRYSSHWVGKIRSETLALIPHRLQADFGGFHGIAVGRSAGLRA